MRKILSILILINSIGLAVAQQPTNAQGIISSYLSKIKTEAVQTNFTLKVIPKNAVTSQSVSGNLIMKGNQFYLTMEEVKVWYDGTTQWAYFAQNNEVTITKPTHEELAETNPMAVLSGYTAKSKISFSKVKRAGFQNIDLTANNKNDAFTKVNVQFIKNGQQLHALQVFNKDGSRNELTLSNYKANVTVQASTFTFDKNRHPGVLINDLR